MKKDRRRNKIPVVGQRRSTPTSESEACMRPDDLVSRTLGLYTDILGITDSRNWEITHWQWAKVIQAVLV